MEKSKNVRPILAISSGGGHWMQLLRLRPAWEGYTVVYASVNPEYRSDISPALYYVIPDGNLHKKFALLKVLVRVLILVMKVRPVVIISTGAAPGFFALVFGKILGSKTVWIDSIANAEELSVSGRKIRLFADAWLTQWEHLAMSGGPDYHGSVL